MNRYVRVAAIGKNGISPMYSNSDRLVLTTRAGAEADLIQNREAFRTRGILDTESQVRDLAVGYKRMEECMVFIALDVLAAIGAIGPEDEFETDGGMPLGRFSSINGSGC